jgi:hypothetical protein
MLIPVPDFFPYRIPHPESNNKKEEGENLLLTFFVAISRIRVRIPDPKII